MNNFNIIRHRGKMDEGQLPDGTKVYRKDFIFVPEQNGLIRCADYYEHFIYEIPQDKIKVYPGSAYRCTCGSFAVVAGLSGYVLDASPQGKIFLCHLHATTGKHAGGSQWI